MLACSKCSDSGERCEVKKAMKSRGELGREVREPSLTSPPPSLLFFRDPFYFAPLPTIRTPRTGYRNALTEIAWEDAVWGLGSNVYSSVIEKQGIVAGIVVYRQRVLQTVTSLGVVSLVFRRHDLLKIANFNPQQEARFSLWKKLVPRESGGNGAWV